MTLEMRSKQFKLHLQVKVHLATACRAEFKKALECASFRLMVPGDAAQQQAQRKLRSPPQCWEGVGVHIGSSQTPADKNKKKTSGNNEAG